MINSSEILQVLIGQTFSDQRNWKHFCQCETSVDRTTILSALDQNCLFYFQIFKAAHNKLVALQRGENLVWAPKLEYLVKFVASNSDYKMLFWIELALEALKKRHHSEMLVLPTPLTLWLFADSADFSDFSDFTDALMLLSFWLAWFWTKKHRKNCETALECLN